ncbi:putative SPX domain-containing protein [Helianthus debilis subsp. tardiflorus]
MKFGKEFALQRVPEWREAYMNYSYLKTLLEQILIFRQRQPSESQANRPNLSRSLKRKVSLFRAFSGLRNASLRKHKEDEVIVVNAMQQADEEQGGEGGPSYQTIFLRSSEEGGDLELVFFKRLDNEFNKVFHFYKTKVQEVMKQADELSNQMDALIALRIKVNNPIIEVVHDSGEHKMASLDVLDRVKINAIIDTPMSTVRSVFNNLNLDLNYNKNELKDAQGKLKQAFLELYEKLRFLKNYAYLNQMAFSKIMKKYDKITSRNASDAYLQMVEDSYLSQSDEVAKLIERVEAVFIKHFCNGDRQQGMNTLRPKSKREKHRVSFFVGCFFGCSLALVAAIIISIHARDLLQGEGQTKYMNTIFPLYSLFGFLGSELDFKQVLLLTFGLSVLVLSTALANLEMEMDPETQSYKALTELLPLGLVIVVVLMAICPVNILYRTNRFFFLTCVWHCLCAPLYLVTLPDFFLADQFTSQVQLLRNVEFYACYYGWGDFKKRDAATCNDSNVYKIISIVIAVVPYWIRFLQCIRRYFDGRDSTQAMNGIKYLSTIAAVVSRTIYTQKRGTTLKIIAASTSGVATIFSTYWDLVMDWGLLCRNSENPWLRDKLILPNKSVYFIAMVLNVILRLAWMQTVLDFNEASFLHRNALIAVVASLEIIRRGIWNFFRLENEHLNNVGKFRAVKSVPLPFSYEDEDKDL